jgi:S-formylglutathione hydrolase FrmB
MIRQAVTTVIAIGLLAATPNVVAAQEEGPEASPGLPAGFTGHVECGPSVGPSQWQQIATMSDPRLNGDYFVSVDMDYHSGPGSSGEVWGITRRIENAEGAWQGSTTSAVLGGDNTVTTIVLAGEGAYEGLTTLFEETYDNGTCSSEVRGLIIEGEPPAAPEPYLGEPVAVAEVAEPAAPAAFSELRVADVAELDERTRDLTIESPSVGEVKVRLLLPLGFDGEAEATYPVLYLLHGAEDDYTSWTRETDVEELTADLDLIVAMPDAGAWGWYSDWWNGGEGGVPAWETFHLTELRDILERDWQASDQRVIAGLSMGGYGAMHYATAHPELFRAVASFSAVVDPNGTGRSLTIDPATWGDPDEQADVWATHDPVAMAEALEGMPVYLSWGDGQPGPLDPDDATEDDLEAWVAAQNEALAARLDELGIEATVDTGSGTHTWPYWQQGLHQALPILMTALEG